ncbi:MAG: hypothetical protein RI932_2048, partial [Pseudomonadota bacterium]
MKHIVSVSLFSLVSAFATANSPAPAAAPAATPAPASAPAAASSSASTKVSMRVQLDPFYKNLNQANKNYKTPKLDSFRLKFERDLGQ